MEEGRRVYELFGCIACHATDAYAGLEARPDLEGPLRRHRAYAKGVVRVTANDAYLRESILEPSAKIVTGFGRTGMGMPSYAGVLTAPQVESVILFIKSLK